MKHLPFIIALLFIPFVSATTLHGTVYDISLDVVQNAVITIEGVQKQVIVAKNGTYKIELPQGNYTFLVQKGNETLLEEEIAITSEGEFVVDLVALNLLDEFDESLANEIENVTIEEETERNYPLIFLLALAIIVATFFLFKEAKKASNATKAEIKPPKPPKETILSDDLQPIVEFIKKQEGRTTQKEIYRAFPHSEAKISLMLAELEAKGKIEKIKKGRGNIIILKA